MAGGAVCVDQADVVGERRELGTLVPGWDTSDDPGRGVLLGLEAALDGLHGRYDERGDRVVVVVGVEARQGGVDLVEVQDEVAAFVQLVDEGGLAAARRAVDERGGHGVLPA